MRGNRVEKVKWNKNLNQNEIEIFGQASKNIDGYRGSIASKDVEIEKLKNELEEVQVREQSFQSTSETLQCMFIFYIYMYTLILFIT